MEEQEKKEPKKWKEWISTTTKELILRRRQAWEADDEQLAKALKKEVQKAVKLTKTPGTKN